MKTTTQKINKGHSFRRGWGQLRVKDTRRCREQLMAAFGITTLPSFTNRRMGRGRLTVEQKEEVQRIFLQYGIYDVWGDEE
ncbi:MAG: hypothetical protein LUC33_06250 [Prevotellaceae bacterium]|nr:hypothetical protein [Prevotellaceae bacterium]